MTHIEITYLDGLTDLLLTDNRPKRTGSNDIELLTDNFYSRLDSFEKQQQKVQTISWDKYELNIVGAENYDIGLLKHAKSVLVYDEEIKHTANVMTAENERVGGSDFTHFTLEYYDTNLSNYKYELPPVYEWLKSDALAERLTLSELNVLRIIDSSGEATDFNTTLIFDQLTKAPSANGFENTQTGQTINTNTVIKNEFNLTFYLSGADCTTFMQRVPLADGVKYQGFYLANSIGYQIQEQPEISIEKLGGWDIYRANVNFVYNIINHYSYGDN